MRIRKKRKRLDKFGSIEPSSSSSSRWPSIKATKASSWRDREATNWVPWFEPLIQESRGPFS